MQAEPLLFICAPVCTHDVTWQQAARCQVHLRDAQKASNLLRECLETQTAALLSAAVMAGTAKFDLGWLMVLLPTRANQGLWLRLEVVGSMLDCHQVTTVRAQCWCWVNENFSLIW